MALLFIFLDGVGVGEADARHNPFVSAPMPTWRALAGASWPTLGDAAPRRSPHATITHADATLGVAGLPQSGTGTFTLLTGQNGAAQLGRHDGPFLPRALRAPFEQENLLAWAARAGQPVAFANAFPPFYMERLARGRARRTTCTQAALSAGLTLRGINALEAGQALSSWITNEHWRRLAPQIPELAPWGAGQALARLALGHALTLFEFFHTDHSGHRPDLAAAQATLALLDQFLAGILATLDPVRDLLVIASDHGNFEAQDHSDHTRNPALVTLWGHGHAAIADGLASLADLAPALRGWLRAAQASAPNR